MIIPFHLYERNIQKITAYHGTNNEFEKFDYGYIGIGLDEYGPGFYFSNSYEAAEKYGKVRKYELTFNKYIIKDKKPSKAEVSKLIRWAPQYKDSLTNFGEYETEAFNTALNSLTRPYYDKVDSYFAIWRDFYLKKGNSRQFVENIVRLGYDGYIINEEGHTIYVMYNTNNIRML